MTRPTSVTRPVPHLDESTLVRLCIDEQPPVGTVLEHGGRRYRVAGWDPVSVRPGRVYLEELDSGHRHALVVRDGAE